MKKTRLNTMWRDAVTSLVKPPATEQYPFVREKAPSHLRSKLRWNLDNCTGCGLCAKDCPAQAIDVITLDKKAKRFVFNYHVDRCTFCGQCVVSCRQDCLSMSNDDWELAAPDKKKLVVYYGKADDVESVLDDSAAPGSEDAAAR